MKRTISLLLLILSLFVGSGVSAQSTPQAPAITTFTSSLTTVDRAALLDRTARVPVTWTSANRPIIANLFFEQVLPDGTVVNVELPRVIPWVNSSDNGMAAPIYPGDNVNQITLRVRLVNLITGQVYSERQLTLNIGTGGGGGTGNNNRPSLTRFITSSASVSAAQLANGTARVPVSWSAVNRPVTTNLVFEQILADGSVVNVELPRSNPWVNSVGDGVAAPVAPGGTASSIRLRVRLFDLLSGRVYDQRELTVAINNTPAGQPRISLFSTSYTSVDANELSARTARVPVSWSVDNRPDGSNLVFEQVLPGGTVINVELPRDNPYVSSSGNGTAAPVLPSGASTITLRVRLVNLSNNTTLDQREITLPIRGQVGGGNTVVVDPTQCFNNPFINGNGLSVGGRGRVLVGSLTVYTAPLTASPTAGTLPQNATVSITAGPFCYYLNPAPTGGDQQGNFRMWRVRQDGGTLEGWVHEYSIGIAGVLRNVEPAPVGTPIPVPTATANPGTGVIQIRAFTVSPNPVARGGQVTLTWDVANATTLSITRLSEAGIYIEPITGNLGTSGSVTYTLPTDYINTAQFVLLTNDAQINQYVTVNVTCPFSTSLVSGDCPITQQAEDLVYQPFENGFMLWRGSTGQIFVLYNDGTYGIVQDTWAQGETFDDGRTPPVGRFAPVRGFGKVWYTNANISQRLGWATAQEGSYRTTLETHQYLRGRYGNQTYYWQFPDGRTVTIEPSTWRVG